MNKRRIEADINFVAQIFNIYLDCIWQDIGVVVPDMSDDRILAKRSTLISKEVLKQSEFFTCKLN
ncbi:hypothetical protein D3C73_1375650 [compost metagenome]